MNTDTLLDLARHQVWADGEHWKALRAHAALLEDGEIRKRLNHMVNACEMLQTLARGEAVDFAHFQQDRPSPDELEAAMRKANTGLADALATLDPDRMIALPRGPKGPFEAPAGALLLQAITHGQHHRGQNGARIRQLGITPPMTDFIVWFALGKP